MLVHRLCVAAGGGSWNSIVVMEALVAAGADIDKAQSSGLLWTALMVA
eukprot:COSAG02_NODE_68118_length_251_cov_0.684211_1_plen_47_part_01